MLFWFSRILRMWLLLWIMLLLRLLKMLLWWIVLLLRLLEMLLLVVLWIVMLLSHGVCLPCRMLFGSGLLMNRLFRVGYMRRCRRPVIWLLRMTHRSVAGFIHGYGGRLAMIHRRELCPVRTGLMQMIVLFWRSNYMSF